MFAVGGAHFRKCCVVFSVRDDEISMIFLESLADVEGKEERKREEVRRRSTLFIVTYLDDK